MKFLIASRGSLLVADPIEGTTAVAQGVGRSPTSLTADPRVAGRAWCGTGGGVLRSDDAGASWQPSGLDRERITAVAASPSERDLVWAGAEPSAVWRSSDGGATWEPARKLGGLPSSSRWSFPPKPDTHHVRWIGCHPGDADRLWVAIEAGALVTTRDGGRSWQDRVPGGPLDTHHLAIHPRRPEGLRSAAGDGYFESDDGGKTWSSPQEGLEVGYLRSVAIDSGDPEVIVVSAASHAHSAYVSGRSDGRLFRRRGQDRWERVSKGWPDPPSTIAPLLSPGGSSGELWAADERGLHRSEDGGVCWETVVGFAPSLARVDSMVPMARPRV